MIKGLKVPDPNDPGYPNAYTWWQRGATDEHYLEIEGLDPEAIELLDVVRALGRARPDMTAYTLAGEIARIIYGWEIRDAAANEGPATPTPGETPKTAQHGDFGCCASSGTESVPPATTAEGH